MILLRFIVILLMSYDRKGAVSLRYKMSMYKESDKKRVLQLIKPVISLLLGTALAIFIIQLGMKSEFMIVQCGLAICLEIKLIVQESKRIAKILKEA